jgi:hypothetical protein
VNSDIWTADILALKYEVFTFSIILALNNHLNQIKFPYCMYDIRIFDETNHPRNLPNRFVEYLERFVPGLSITKSRPTTRYEYYPREIAVVRVFEDLDEHFFPFVLNLNAKGMRVIALDDIAFLTPTQLKDRGLISLIYPDNAEFLARTQTDPDRPAWHLIKEMTERKL